MSCLLICWDLSGFTRLNSINCGNTSLCSTSSDKISYKVTEKTLRCSSMWVWLENLTAEAPKSQWVRNDWGTTWGGGRRWWMRMPSYIRTTKRWAWRCLAPKYSWLVDAVFPGICWVESYRFSPQGYKQLGECCNCRSCCIFLFDNHSTPTRPDWATHLAHWTTSEILLWSANTFSAAFSGTEILWRALWFCLVFFSL